MLRRSFAQNLNQTGGVWWQDKTHEQGVEPTPWHEEPEDRMVGRSRRNSKGQLRTTGSLKPTVAARDPFKERTLTVRTDSSGGALLRLRCHSLMRLTTRPHTHVAVFAPG